MSFRSGRHFLHIPGPSNVPDRILRAIDRPTIDHRGPEFAELVLGVLPGLRELIGTSGPVFLFPSSGSGAQEAALVNTLSAGDTILVIHNGFFATIWQNTAQKLGLKVEILDLPWETAVDPNRVAERLSEDPEGEIKAVLLVHNETSSGVTNHVPDVRRVLDQLRHPALLLVDTVSSLGSILVEHEKWGVDVTVSSSQKGMMLPPGLAIQAVSPRALAAAEFASLPRAYWDWKSHLSSNETGFFPSTPATNLLYGLSEAITMLQEEGFEQVYRRHHHLAEATRAAVRGWGLEIFCQSPQHFSPVLTAVLLPEGFDSDAIRDLILDRFDLSLGTGLGRLKGRVFRIGHLGSLNELMLAGALCGIEMGLQLAGVPIREEGVKAALQVLRSRSELAKK